MLYSELLNSDFFQKAFQKANVHEIGSPLLEKGDFPSGFPDDLFTNPRNQHFVDSLHEITDREILARCSKVQSDQISREHEIRMRPYKEKEKKAEFVKPIVEKYLHGNLKPGFDIIERELVNSISNEIADSSQFEIDQENNVQPVNEHKRDDSLSELDNLLKEASILHLTSEVSADELILKAIHSNYSKLLK